MQKPKLGFVATLVRLAVAGLGLECLPVIAVSTIHLTISAVPVEIPIPVGFAPVTTAMTNLIKSLEARVPPHNKLLVSFIPTNEIALALKGSVPSLTRSLSVQIPWVAPPDPVTDSDFADIKEALRRHNALLLLETEKQVPGSLRQLADNLTNALALNPVLRSLSTITFPIHDDSDTSISFSSIAISVAPGTNGVPEKRVSVTTATLVHLKQTVFHLYAYGDENDLQWSRRLSRQWTDAILQMNSPEVLKQEQ